MGVGCTWQWVDSCNRNVVSISFVYELILIWWHESHGFCETIYTVFMSLNLALSTDAHPSTRTTHHTQPIHPTHSFTHTQARNNFISFAESTDTRIAVCNNIFNPSNSWTDRTAHAGVVHTHTEHETKGKWEFMVIIGLSSMWSDCETNTQCTPTCSTILRINEFGSWRAIRKLPNFNKNIYRNARNSTEWAGARDTTEREYGRETVRVRESRFH